MKSTRKVLLSLAIFLSSISVFADIASVEVMGTFENSEGCRAYEVNCYHFEDEDSEQYNRCSMEVFIDGEQVAYLGKRGKMIVAKGNKIVGRDKGVRSTFSAPKYVNVKAEFTIKSDYVNPLSNSKKSVSSFDLVIRKGALGKEVANCKNMEFSD